MRILEKKIKDTKRHVKRFGTQSKTLFFKPSLRKKIHVIVTLPTCKLNGLSQQYFCQNILNNYCFSNKFNKTEKNISFFNPKVRVMPLV